MRHVLIELTAAIVLTFAAIIASVPGAKASDVVVIGAFSRASATPVARSGAAYMTIVNRTAAGDRLLAIATKAARSAELHQSVVENGVMTMRQVDSVELPPGATVAMSPGGLHVMLMGLSAPLKEGGSIEMVLTFEKAGDLTLLVPIEGVAAGQPSGG